MSKASNGKAETAVSADEQIDSLKVAEKEKLAAAEEAYAQKQYAGGQAPAAEPAAFEREAEMHGDPKRLAWLPGLILIGLGLLFLANNVTDFSFDNWWALFILIPAVGSFSKAIDALRSGGEFTRAVWSAIAGGLFFTLIAAAFLFELDWGLIWPAFLIIGGVSMIFGALQAE